MLRRHSHDFILDHFIARGYFPEGTLSIRIWVDEPVIARVPIGPVPKTLHAQLRVGHYDGAVCDRAIIFRMIAPYSTRFRDLIGC